EPRAVVGRGDRRRIAPRRLRPGRPKLRGISAPLHPARPRPRPSDGDDVPLARGLVGQAALAFADDGADRTRVTIDWRVDVTVDWMRRTEWMLRPVFV